MDSVHFSNALDEVWKLVARSNKYIDETEPWILAKDETKKDELDSVLAHLAASLRLVAILIQHVMTHTLKEIFALLGLNSDDMAIQCVSYFVLSACAQVVTKRNPILSRLDVEEEQAYIKSTMTK